MQSHCRLSSIRISVHPCPTPGFTNDLFEFDPAALAWRTLDPGTGVADPDDTVLEGNPADGPPPGPTAAVGPVARAQAVFFGAGDGLYVFGGLGKAPVRLSGSSTGGEPRPRSLPPESASVGGGEGGPEGREGEREREESGGMRGRESE
jgi:hypothetical protein